MVTSLPQVPDPVLTLHAASAQSWNKGTQTENNTLLAVQGQLLELIAAGCQQDKIQQDSRED